MFQIKSMSATGCKKKLIYQMSHPSLECSAQMMDGSQVQVMVEIADCIDQAKLHHVGTQKLGPDHF